MRIYESRDYREKINARGLASFNVIVKETDLRVSAQRDLSKETMDKVLLYRHQLENYIKFNPGFLASLTPYRDDPFAPTIIREMIVATRDIGVGPMASVAGAIAHFVGTDLLMLTDQVIIENGGDIFMKIDRDATVSIFAGGSPLSEKIGIKIPKEMMPVGICSSSGSVGHSLSMGSSDAVTVVSPSAIRADGAATALGNRVRTKKDLDKIPDWAEGMAGILGCVAILGDTMATWGDIELVAL
ncbi:MAG: UPF0280 family protein [Deltaproteobacteria bacterium]|nr:UPF0280 family protein [Deltaproteobacteria bacterium]